MAVRLITKINRYLGTAAEMAAMDATGVPAGSTFFTTDEGLLYVLDSAGNWSLKKSTVELSGSKVEQASAQDTQVATTVKTYTKAAGAAEIEVFVESGSIRIRTDGEACTATTGQPLGAGWSTIFNTGTISIYFVANSTITVVSR